MGCERAIKRTSPPKSLYQWDFSGVATQKLEELRSPAETGNELPYYKQRHVFLIGQKTNALSTFKL